MSYEDPQSNSLCKPYFLKVSVVLTCHMFFYLSHVCVMVQNKVFILTSVLWPGPH